MKTNETNKELQRETGVAQVVGLGYSVALDGSDVPQKGETGPVPILRYSDSEGPVGETGLWKEDD